jgi:hypothetical protein
LTLVPESDASAHAGALRASADTFRNIN